MTRSPSCPRGIHPNHGEVRGGDHPALAIQVGMEELRRVAGRGHRPVRFAAGVAMPLESKRVEN